MKIAIVTGASSGMGKEFVLQLNQYVSVDEIWVIARRENALESLKEQSEIPLKVIALDLCKEESYEKLYSVLAKAKAHCISRKISYSVRTRGGATHLLLSEIKYIEYADKHLFFYTDKGIFSERGQIGETASRLEDFGFIQVHQGFIVNSRYVRSVQRDTVILDDGTGVMMSVKRRSKVVKAIEEQRQQPR